MVEDSPIIENIADSLKTYYSATINNNNPYFDNRISHQIIKTIEKLIKNFNKQNLCLLLVLFSIDFLKNEISNLLKELFSVIKTQLINFDYKELYTQIKQFVSNIVTYMRNLKSNMYSKSITDIVQIETPIDFISMDVNFTPIEVFWENLYDYVNSSENNSLYDVEIINFEQNNKNEYEYTQKLHNLKITYNDISIIFNNTVENRLILNNNNLKFKSSKNLNICGNYNKNKVYDTILDLCPFKEFVKEFSEHQIDFIKNSRNIVMGPVTVFNVITHALHDNYNIKSSKGCTYTILSLFVYLSHPYSIINVPTNNKTLNFSEHTLVNIEGAYITDKIMNTKIIDCLPGSMYKNWDLCLAHYKYDKKYACQDKVIEWILTDVYPKLKSVKQTTHVIKKNIVNTKFNNLSISLQSSNLQAKLIDNWKEFLVKLNNKSNIIKADNDSEINIYEIIINRKKIITKEYKGKQIITKQLDNNLENDTINKESESSKNKTIVETVIDSQEEEFIFDINIEFKLLNNTYKDFTTLYLKEYDKLVLSTTLNNFKNKQDIYKELGLPYKFGALLYGDPGTGKSSSILAIASYLQKNIYYLDMNNITTNEELKTVFNKVNKEISNNGIIVMEDIDVMTNIVHKRGTVNMGESKLTLECFLNLLQGTLTHNGSIFIATTNNIDILDDAFIRDGRFDIKIELGNCDHFQMNLIYQKFFKRNIPKNLISQIPEYKMTPATFISKLIPYILTDIDDEIIITNISSKK